MNLTNVVVLGIVLLAGTAMAFSVSDPDRRAFLTQAVAAAASTTLLFPNNSVRAEETYDDYIATESGMKYKVLKEGTGATPQPGQTVLAHYTGWLNGFDSEKKFDSSRDRNRPFSFAVGTGRVIRGWDESFLSMSVGERRRIILPPRLAYGDRGAGGVIPGGATLYFDVELLKIQ